jgi:hypothetical protein
LSFFLSLADLLGAGLDPVETKLSLADDLFGGLLLASQFFAEFDEQLFDSFELVLRLEDTLVALLEASQQPPRAIVLPGLIAELRAGQLDPH